MAIECLTGGAAEPPQHRPLRGRAGQPQLTLAINFQ